MHDQELPVIIAEQGDIPALHALVESAYRGESAKRGWTHEADLLDGQRTDQEALRAIIDDDDQRIMVVRNERSITGCVQVAKAGDNLAYLGLLTVNPDIQAQGLGKKLMATAELYTRDIWDAKAIEMTVIRQRSDLIAYYERRGYALTGETRAFPLDDPEFGLPKTRELEFVVLKKNISK